MGANQDIGAYDVVINSGDGNWVYFTDTYTTAGTVTFTVYVWGDNFSSESQITITTDAGSITYTDIGDWLETVYGEQAARYKEFELSMAANDLLIIDLYNIAIANINFNEYVMPPSNAAVFNEIFDGGLSEIWAQDDYNGDFVTNPGAYTSSTFYPLGYHAGPTGTDHAYFLSAVLDEIDINTEDIYINFGLFYSGYYRSVFFLYAASVSGWIKCSVGGAVPYYSEDPYEIALLSACILESGGNIEVYQGGYTLTSVPVGNFDGKVTGIAILDIYNQIAV